MSDSTGRLPRRKQPNKPGKDLPLGFHKHIGDGTKAVNGRHHYVGKAVDDPKGVAPPPAMAGSKG